MRRMLTLPAMALAALCAVALTATTASASFCGGSTAWRALTNAAYVQFADPALQRQLSYFEQRAVARDLALLETKTVGTVQIAALERLAEVIRIKFGRTPQARPFLSVAYLLEGKAWHIISEHAGSLVAADKAEGISNS